MDLYEPFPVFYGFANVSSNTTAAVVISSAAGRQIRVMSMLMVCGSVATNITFLTGTGTGATVISSSYANAANGGATLPFSPVGWFQTSSGQALTATAGSAGSPTGLTFTYRLV